MWLIRFFQNPIYKTPSFHQILSLYDFKEDVVVHTAEADKAGEMTSSNEVDIDENNNTTTTKGTGNTKD